MDGLQATDSCSNKIYGEIFQLDRYTDEYLR